MMAAEGTGVPFYVAREVLGEIPVVLNKPIKNEDGTVGIEKIPSTIKDPVIIFFPNGTSQVMSSKVAGKHGFLDTPDIMGHESVKDPKTPAGRYLMAMSMKERRRGWMDMEMMIINNVLSTAGTPLPRNVEFSEKSIYIDDDETPKLADPSDAFAAA